MAEVDEFLERRRAAVAEQWDFDSEVVLIGAGERIHIPGRADQTYPFRAHSEYLYLTDRERPGGVLAFDPTEGWVDFVAPVTNEERLWEGADDLDDEGVPLPELAEWLTAREGRPIISLGVPVQLATAALDAEARAALNRVRRPKDALELARMRRAEQATSAGFAEVLELIEPGRTERELQIELEAAFLRNGADCLAYETIVGSGPNSAVLHFPPGGRRLEPDELVLIDAGGECRWYASDITRTYPVSGQFTPQQAELHALVQAAKLAAIEECVVGAEWVDVHRTAARVIAEGLIDFGLLRGDADTLVERGAVTVFFPHGIGHMVGLGVRDAGEVLQDRTLPPGFPPLRMNLPLVEDYVVTVEPGIYFVPALIGDPELRSRLADEVDWARAERMLGFGGIRIEENVLVTADGPAVLTADVPLTR
jgi:Xaa-Pro aminopeptidase